MLVLVYIFLKGAKISAPSCPAGYNTAKFVETGNGSRIKKEKDSEVPQSAQATIPDYSPLLQPQLIMS